MSGKWGDTFLMEGNGMACAEPFDIICGGCGSPLVRDRTFVANWTVLRTGYVLVDGVEHQCQGDLTTSRHVFALMLSSDVRALEQSVGVT